LKKKEQKIHEEWDPRKHRIHYGLKHGFVLPGEQFKGKGTHIGESPSLTSLTRGVSQTSGDSYKNSPLKSSAKVLSNTIEEEKTIKNKQINDFNTSKSGSFSPTTQPGTIIGGTSNRTNAMPTYPSSQNSSITGKPGTGTVNKPGTNTAPLGSGTTGSTNKPTTAMNTSGSGFGVGTSGPGASNRTSDVSLTKKPTTQPPPQSTGNTQARPSSQSSNKPLPPKTGKK